MEGKDLMLDPMLLGLLVAIYYLVQVSWFIFDWFFAFLFLFNIIAFIRLTYWRHKRGQRSEHSHPCF